MPRYNCVSAIYYAIRLFYIAGWLLSAGKHVIGVSRHAIGVYPRVTSHTRGSN